MSCSVCIGYSEADCPCCSIQYDVVDCPECGGSGESDYRVWDIHLRQEKSCDRLSYLTAAESEDEAYERGQQYCRLSCICKTCNGVGTIWK